ncbi:beta-galactosidase 15-like [Prosopis cineraria]|uniref:beta-galactosidase 15-like n=1 Tax=Prosopis cineraria TaxID=364024 RepID=UPI00240F5C58|nr:beta-galactosidase 15-like [Prosopis cineraria]
MKMTIKKAIISILLLCLAFITVAKATNVSHDGRAFTIDGQRRILISGSIHYPRSTAEMWPDLIRKSKEGGLNVIETYVFWNAHEPIRGQYDFSGNLDLVRFIKDIKKEGLYALLRIGPYVCAEWNYGGFPVWLHNIPNIEFRTMNKPYLDEMKRFTTLIVDMMKKEKLFASQGGPIISAQIENEYGNIMGQYGEAGKEYVNWCAQLASSYQIGVPWIMCQQSDAPQPMINTCNGYYCDKFTPNNKNSPKAWTENWTGWYKNWGGQDPHRTAEDVAYAVAKFYQSGGTLQNYYMYHGGTNFGRSAGGPYITTSYDYDAPLDEYGNLNQPKWGHLNQLHRILLASETALTYGNQTTTDFGNMVTGTSYEHMQHSVCFLGNGNESSDATVNFRNKTYTVPAWSVTILRNCSTEIYNTAKVNTQTTVMIKKEEPQELKWQWRNEPPQKKFKVATLTVSELLDQKVVTNDTSDYLWYFTSVNLNNKSDPLWGKDDVSIRVNTSSHLIHVFVNGLHVGAQFTENGHYKFQHESKIKLRPGKNEISLLSGTVGLPNYGAFFDNVKVGILGPVVLAANDTTGKEQIVDISKNQWTYKVGLQGQLDKLFSLPEAIKPWLLFGLPRDKPMVWYKTWFKTPSGTDPVVVDLKGLGKGEAWVNGNSLGRYWSSYISGKDGCSAPCDYRGPYKPNKCLINCGNPTQRWYHVPRSFLNGQGLNSLVLFEDKGGNPNGVRIGTVKPEKICANTYENHKLDLICNVGQVISEIKFASFGQPNGSCGSFQHGSCSSPQALSAINKLCTGKQECSFQVSEEVLGATGCGKDKHNRLALEAICK